MSRSGMLLIVCGPSGAGKSSLCHHLLDRYPRTRFSVSYTTRAPRGREVDGVDYHFVPRERFDAMIAEEAFAEWAEVHGNRYGTSRSTVSHALQVGHDLLFDIDVQGAAQLRAAFPEAVTVMVTPPSWALLEARLRARGTDAEDVIQRRLEKARWELERFDEFDYLLLNDDLAESQQAIEAIYLASARRVVLQARAAEALLKAPR